MNMSHRPSPGAARSDAPPAESPPSKRPPSAGGDAPSLNPFPGPQPYRASDRGRFYGRETLAAKLEASILANRCVTVHGPSGAGKSSLVQASVLPTLIEAHDARAVRIDGWPENEDPVLWLALSMFSDLKLGEVTLGLGPAEAVTAAAKRAARASSRLMVVYLDQLEQLFYPGRSVEQTEPFFECLQQLVELPLRTVRVVLSLREDYLGRFRDRLRDRGRVLDNSFRVGPLTVAELTEAVCQAAASGEPPQAWSPEEMRSLMLQVRVPGQAADDDAEAQAAYAQIVCRALFTQRAQDSAGKPSDVAEAETILRDYLETTLSALGPLREPAQCVLEDQLVTADGSRTLRTERELLRQVPADSLQPILKALEGAAILHAEEHQGSRYFEIGHDWLARKVFEQRQAREAEMELRRREEARRREQEEREAELARRLAKARRERLRLLGLAAGALVFAAVTGVLFYVARSEKEKAVAAQEQASQARIEAVRKRIEAADQRILAGYLALSSRGDRASALKLLPEVHFPAERKGWVSYASDALAENALSVTLRGHTAALTAAAFSPDGKRVLTASVDGTARLWNAGGDGAATVLSGHQDAVTFAAQSPDGQRVLTTSEDGTARIWEASGEHRQLDITGAGHILCGAWSPDGKRVATGGQDGLLRVHSIDGSAAPLVLKGHEGPIRDLIFLPDGSRVVTASDDATARLWDLTSTASPVKLGVHDQPVHTLAASAGGELLALTSGRTTAGLYSLSGAAPAMERALDCGVSEAVHAAVSPGGDRWAVACSDGTARVADTHKPGAPVVLTGATGALTRVAFRPDGKFLATASVDAAARVYSVLGGRPALVLAGHAGRLGMIAWSQDGSRLVTAAADERRADHTAKVWSAAGLRASGEQAGLSRPAHEASFGQGGALIAAAHDDDTASVRRADGEGTTVVLKGHEGWVAYAAPSPSGDRVVTASFDGTARIFRADGTGESIVLKGHSAAVHHASWSADGGRVVTASEDGSARVWDAAKGEVLATLSGHDDWLTWAAFSPDGTRVVTASHDRTAKVWSADGKGAPLELGGHLSTVSSAVFSSDGKRVITTSEMGTVRVWSSDGKGEPLLLRGREGGAPRFVVASGGDRIAVVSEEGLIHVWSFSGLPIVLAAEMPILALTFAEGDQALLAVLADGTLHRWQIDVDTLRNRLKAAHADCLPADVRMQYLDEPEECATYTFDLCESAHKRRPAPEKVEGCDQDDEDADIDLLASDPGKARPGSAFLGGGTEQQQQPRRRAKDLGPDGRHVKVIVLPGDAEVTIGGAVMPRRSGAIELVGKKGDRVRLRASHRGEFLETDVTIEDQGASPAVVDLRPKLVPPPSAGTSLKKRLIKIDIRSFLPDVNL